MLPNSPKWSRMLQNGPKWSQMVRKGPKWSQMVSNGPIYGYIWLYMGVYGYMGYSIRFLTVIGSLILAVPSASPDYRHSSKEFGNPEGPLM